MLAGMLAGAGSCLAYAQEAATEAALQATTEHREEEASGITAQSYKEVLEKLTARVRMAGTEGEKKAAEEIAEAMEGFGYQVTRQAFDLDGREAVNVIAVKKAEKNPNGDILIVSAHHDSKDVTVGANDNASGTAMVLELARVLANVESDTEIRFITFSGEEEGLRGSARYVSELSEAEKSHIVGDIQIDMIGHYMAEKTTVCTTMGEEGLLSRMIQEASGELEGSPWELEKEAASDHSSFTFAGIPSVLVEQDILGAENHKFSDRPEIIDSAKAAETAAVLEKTIEHIASEETGSLAEQSHAMLGDARAEITDDTPLLFGAKKEEAEVKAGIATVFEREEKVEELDWILEHYQAQVKWFGWQEALRTDFVYRKTGENTLNLEEVYIYTADLKLTDEELQKRLTEAMGEPETYEDGTKLWGSSESAENLAMRQYQIVEKDHEQAIQVTAVFHSELGADLKTFDFKKDPKEFVQSCDTAELALLEAVHKIIPQDDPYIGNIISWTDGYSSMLGSCTARDIKKSDCFDVRIDKYDFFDEAGNILDTGKLLATMVHEYAHALTLNAEQINVEKLTEFPDYNDAALYREGSYLKAFYDRFYAEGKKRDYDEHPEDYVSTYGGEGGIFEDIAETFMVFVTMTKPEEDSTAAEKVRFFYSYQELVEIRNYIRGNFGYIET